jgi:diguanylate cyclase (GGDEF)-like protein
MVKSSRREVKAVNFKGRLFCILLILSIHTLYVTYYFVKYGFVEWIEVVGYPVFLLIAYWTGLQYDRAKFYAEKDALTNLYNRRFVLHSFGKIANIVKRNNRKYYVLVVDCDNFKQINDTYGHAVGDTVLHKIGYILKERTRSTDIAARWGGDEFLLIGQYEGEKALEGLIRRIKHELDLLAQELQIPISASIGSAICPDDHHILQELISMADKKMYLIKEKNKQERAS